MSDDHKPEDQKPDDHKGDDHKPDDHGNGVDNDPQSKTRRLVGHLATALIILVAILSIALVMHRNTVNPRTQDASVGAHYIGVASEVAGRVWALYARDNQCVEAGTLLVQLDPRQYEYNLAKALADQKALEEEIVEERRTITAAEYQVVSDQGTLQDSRLQVQSGNDSVSSAMAQVTQAKASLSSANDEYAYAELTVRRNAPLAADEFISRQQFDQYKTNRDTALSSVKSASAQVKVSEEKLAEAKTQVQQSVVNVGKSEANIRKGVYSVPILGTLLAQRPSAQAAVDKATLDLKWTRIYAPFAGCTTSFNTAEGAYASPGTPLFTFIDQSSWYIDADYRESQLDHIRPGMKAQVFLMSDPSHPIIGVVQSISPGVTSSDASSEGGLPGTPGGLPLVQRTLNWVRLATRYAVRVKIQPNKSQAMRIGTSAEVYLKEE